jgi:hypothetical protein
MKAVLLCACAKGTSDKPASAARMRVIFKHSPRMGRCEQTMCDGNRVEAWRLYPSGVDTYYRSERRVR